MKKLLTLCLAAAAATGSQAVVLFDNGAAAAGTPPISVIRTGGTLFGAGAQSSVPNLVADNFTVGGPGWNVESLTFYGYQSFAGSAFTFTGATWSVISGDVNTGTVVASGTSSVTNGGLVGYRVTPTTLTNTDRAIFAVQADVPDFNLAPGNYWLRWGLSGTLASGPWQPPTADGVVGNAAQSLANAAFATLVDAGDGLGIELPFTIQGSVVPEPSTYAMLLAGAAAVLSITRRRQRG
jgi:hypothetical protein